LKEKGIIHRYTCFYSSDQNGIVERKHMHIVESGLSLLARANLPLKFWPEAFNTAIYLINRPLTGVLGGISPIEKLQGVKPDYYSLQTFGCLCFPYLRPYNNNK
jgi:hypothetical protein